MTESKHSDLERIKQLETEIMSLRSQLNLLRQQPKEIHNHYHSAPNPYPGMPLSQQWYGSPGY